MSVKNLLLTDFDLDYFHRNILKSKSLIKYPIQIQIINFDLKSKKII